MTAQKEIWPLVVVGAGAAGLTAAIFAGRAQVRTLVLDGRRHPGAKIRASGGGRCNVMPEHAEHADFFTQGSANSLRRVLDSWPLQDMRHFFEDELGLPLHAENTGKLFPMSNNARDVVRVLMEELARVHAVLRTEAKVVQLGQHDGLWRLQLQEGAPVWARRVVLATGGLSMPTTGSDGTGLRIAAALGHEMVPTAPALVPLTGHHPDLSHLAGVSCEAQVTAVSASGGRKTLTGSMLFTHKGYSGPVMLDISQWLVGGPNLTPMARLEVGFGTPCALSPSDPASWQQRLGRAGGKTVHTVVREALPRRLADALVAAARLPGDGGDGRASELGKDGRRRLLGLLLACTLPVSGTEGYRTAEVTTGGVSLDEVACKTLQSRRCPGLYLTGEMLDVTGRLGGFNFMWAWASGHKAGLAAAADLHSAVAHVAAASALSARDRSGLAACG